MICLKDVIIFFKESFVFIAMEVIAVKELSWKYTTLRYEYHYQSK